MEVNVLQWLSNDENLSSIINSGKDLYKQIWGIITKQEPTDNHRTLCKNIFLPVVFGQGPKSLSKKIGISEENASRLIDSLVRSFPVAFNWVKSQHPDSNNIATDVFGRKRKFEDQEQYKIKNFCIQSPASIICLRKLVRLHDALDGKANICFHVHDGYCVLCNKNDVNAVSKIGIKTLEEDDELFPGLKLKITCNFGHNLNNLKSLKKEVLI
jgi:DNA polymerase I-like protein with 3'-5' exonuclease and polymerase domains